MIVITGATGRLGLPRSSTGCSNGCPRAPSGSASGTCGKAAALAERGVRVRAGDFTDPATLKEAFEGADEVLVVSASIRGDGAVAANTAARRRRPAPSGGPDPARNPPGRGGRLAVRPGAAARRRPRRTWWRRASRTPPCATASTRAPSSTTSGPPRETGQFAPPQDGPFSWTAHADLAEAPRRADPAALDGLTPPLTAPDAPRLHDVARVVGRITGASVVARRRVEGHRGRARACPRSRRVHARHVPGGAGRSSSRSPTRPWRTRSAARPRR